MRERWVVLLALGLVPGGAWAQQAADAPRVAQGPEAGGGVPLPQRGPEPRAAAPRLVLTPGTVVRVTGARGQHTGRVVAQTGDALVLDMERPGRVELPLGSVHQVEVRERAAGWGALVGGGVGALAGGLVLGSLCQLNEEDRAQKAGCIAGGAAGGALLGAGTGLLVGSAVTSWRTVWTAPGVVATAPRPAAPPAPAAPARAP